MVDKITKISGWLPFLMIAFLNAFVDLGHKIIIQKSYIAFDYTIRIPFSTKVYFWFKFGGLPLLNKFNKRNNILKLFGYSVPPQ